MAKQPEAKSPSVTEIEETTLSNESMDKELIQRYYNRFRRASSAVATKQSLWTVLDTFDRGDQWKQTNLPPWIPKPTTNFIRYIRTLKRANLASAIPKSKFSALYTEDAPLMARLQKAYEHVWTWEKVDRTVRRCIDRSLLQGTSIAYVYADDSYVGGKYYGKNNTKNALFSGKICVKRFPITNFFPDPDAYDVASMKFCEMTEVLPMSQVRNTAAYREYCKKQGTLKDLDALKGDQMDREDTADGTILNRDVQPGSTGQNINGDDLITVHIHMERYLGSDNAWHLDVTYYTKNNYFALLRIEDAKPNVYPIAVLHDEEEEQSFFGNSIAMDILENQKVINKTAQTSSIIGVLHQNPQKVVSKESGINAQELARTGTMPGKVWTTNGDPEKSIYHVQPPEIPKGLFEMEDRMKNDIKDIAGINEAYTGQSVGSLTTSTGVNSLIERATVRDKDKMIQIDEFVEQISDLIIKFILHKWKEERPIAVPQPDGSVSRELYTPIDDDMIENLEWYVKCDTYAHAPTTQAQRRQAADNIMNLQGQYNFKPALITPQEWIRLQEFDFADEILARMKQDADMMAKMPQSQPPKIAPNGEISFSLASKDPNVVQDTLQQMMKNAQLDAQLQQALLQSHVNNGIDTVGNQPGTASGDPSAPQGTTGALAMQYMAQGR